MSLCQGILRISFTGCIAKSLSFRHLKHLELIPFDRFLTCSWDFSISNPITLDSQDRPDLMCMHTILFNIFSKYDLCNNHVTPINLSLLVSSKLYYKELQQDISHYKLRT
jgi:hypothetical protein